MLIIFIIITVVVCYALRSDIMTKRMLPNDKDLIRLYNEDKKSCKEYYTRNN